MDAKQAKSLLKNAREAIRNKDFKEALKHCKVRGDTLLNGSYQTFKINSPVYMLMDNSNICEK